MTLFAVWPYFLLVFVVSIACGRLPPFKLVDDARAAAGMRTETLDGLRGFLALSVFVHHFVITHRYLQSGIWDYPPSAFYTLLGQVGFGGFFGQPAAPAAATESDRMKKKGQVIAVPDQRTSSIIISAAGDLMPQIAAMITQLDADTSKKESVYVIPLENAEVTDVLPVLQDMFNKNTTSSKSSASSQNDQNNALNARATRNNQQATTASTTGRNMGAGGGGGGAGGGGF